MTELPSAGSGRGKRLTKRQRRELMRKQQRSYMRGDKIQKLSDDYHTQEEIDADQELDREIQDLESDESDAPIGDEKTV